MSKFKVEFTLKQHTPIIHFQSHQMGATLRATELKPKFDRFLKEFVFNEEIPEEFLINGQEDALDYKVKIIASGDEIGLPNNFLFFANNSATPEEVKHTKKSASIAIIFFTYNSKLKEVIENNFTDFLLIYNFGARSSKGYGGFSVHTINKQIVNISQKEINSTLKKYYPFVFKIDNVPYNRWEDKVDTTQKLLKSGINFRSYHKSLLFQYMCQKNIRWEKRKIKEEFSKVATGKPPIDCNTPGEYRYIRVVLGLAGLNEFVVGRDRYTIKIEDVDKEIERFTSPITYKLINDTFYLLCNRSYEKILDKNFKFSFNNKSFKIKTPTKKEFDLYEFLKFVEKQENIISEVN